MNTIYNAMTISRNTFWFHTNRDSEHRRQVMARLRNLKKWELAAETFVTTLGSSLRPHVTKVREDISFSTKDLPVIFSTFVYFEPSNYSIANTTANIFAFNVRV